MAVWDLYLLLSIMPLMAMRLLTSLEWMRSLGIETGEGWGLWPIKQGIPMGTVRVGPSTHRDRGGFRARRDAVGVQGEGPAARGRSLVPCSRPVHPEVFMRQVGVGAHMRWVVDAVPAERSLSGARRERMRSHPLGGGDGRGHGHELILARDTPWP